MPAAKKPASKMTLRYDMYMKWQEDVRRMAKAKRFVLSNNFKVIFILPISDRYSPMDQMKLIGEPHTTGKNQLSLLVKAFRSALKGEEITVTNDVYRIDASKYWGLEGKIIVRNIITPDFDYLRQIK